MSFPDTQLAPMDFTRRIPSLQESFSVFGIDALLVTSLENVSYLTGFTGSAAYLLVTGDRALLTTDGRYGEQIGIQTSAAGLDAEICVGNISEQLKALSGLVSSSQCKRIGFEESIAWSLLKRMAQSFSCDIDNSGSAGDITEPSERIDSGSYLISVKDAVEQLRITKDVGEIARIRRACQIADLALADVKSLLKTGISEKDFATELDYKMKKFLADGISFDTIVASGEHSAMPHASPTERIMREGDLVVIDFGAEVEGYHSDMTRTYALGHLNSEMTEVYEAVAASQEAGVKAVREGVSCLDVDIICRSVLDEKDLGKVFSHGTGHGVGLLIHEAPYLGPASTDILKAGSVVTVEPGAYLAGKGGVRIEDTVVVMQDTCEVLTQTIKEYIY